MSILTSFLKLFKYDPIVDKDSTFNITQALNDNWDKIDADKKAQDDAIAALGEAVGNIQIPVTSVNEKTGAVMLSAADVGAETPSEAQSKANAALNAANDYTDGVAGTLSTQMADLALGLQNHETAVDPHTQYTLDSEYNGHVGFQATESAKGHIEIATQAEVTAGTDTKRAVVPKYLKTELDKRLLSSAYTAADVLAKIKTVDGAGSGLDADLLDGKQASVFQTFNKIYGNTSLSGTANADTVTNKTVVIGSGKKECIVVIGESTNKLTVFKVGTDKTKTYSLDGKYNRQLNGSLEAGIVGGYTRIKLTDIYISGSNLVFSINNPTTQAEQISANVAWEVW